MKIEKGNVFICEKDYFMDKGDLAYIRGKIYTSNEDGYLPSEIYQEHGMEIDSDFNEHFTRILDKDPINPDHYSFNIRGVDCDLFDIGNAMGLNIEQFTALRYMRKKTNQIEDTEKAIKCLQRLLDKLRNED